MSRSRRSEFHPCRACNTYLTRNKTGLCPGCRTDPPPQVTVTSGILEIPFRCGTVRMTTTDAITLAHNIADTINNGQDTTK